MGSRSKLADELRAIAEKVEAGEADDRVLDLVAGRAYTAPDLAEVWQVEANQARRLAQTARRAGVLREWRSTELTAGRPPMLYAVAVGDAPTPDVPSRARLWLNDVPREGATGVEMAQRWGVCAGTASRRLQQLDDLGMLERVTDGRTIINVPIHGGRHG